MLYNLNLTNRLHWFYVTFSHERKQQIKEANENDTTKRNCWPTRWFKTIALIVFAVVLKSFSLFKPLFKTIMFLYDLGSKHIRKTLSIMSVSFVIIPPTLKNPLISSILANANFLLGDVIVGQEQYHSGDVIWGNVIMLLVLLPNLLFIIWFTLAQRRKLFLMKEKTYTWIKILVSGMVQLITVIR